MATPSLSGADAKSPHDLDPGPAGHGDELTLPLDADIVALSQDAAAQHNRFAELLLVVLRRTAGDIQRVQEDGFSANQGANRPDAFRMSFVASTLDDLHSAIRLGEAALAAHVQAQRRLADMRYRRQPAHRWGMGQTELAPLPGWSAPEPAVSRATVSALHDELASLQADRERLVSEITSLERVRGFLAPPAPYPAALSNVPAASALATTPEAIFEAIPEAIPDTNPDARAAAAVPLSAAPSATMTLPVSPTQVAPPQGALVPEAPAQVTPAPIAPAQVPSAQMAPARVAPEPVAPPPHEPAHVPLAQAAPPPVEPAYPPSAQAAPTPIQPAYLEPARVAPPSVTPVQATPAQVTPVLIALDQATSGPVTPDQAAPVEAAPVEAAPAEAVPDQATAATAPPSSSMEPVAAGGKGTAAATPAASMPGPAPAAFAPASAPSTPAALTPASAPASPASTVPQIHAPTPATPPALAPKTAAPVAAAPASRETAAPRALAGAALSSQTAPASTTTTITRAPSRPRRRWASLSWAWTALLGLLLVVLVPLVTPVPDYLGYQLFAVEGGSMEPTIPLGSVIAVRAVPARSLGVGDIITFADQSRPDVRVTHRIIGLETRNGEALATTKGDANTSADSWNVPVDRATGRVAFHVPLLGYVMVWLGTPLVKLGALLLIVVLFLVPSMLGGRRKKEDRPPAEPPVDESFEDLSRDIDSLIGGPHAGKAASGAGGHRMARS